MRNNLGVFWLGKYVQNILYMHIFKSKMEENTLHIIEVYMFPPNYSKF